MKYKLMSFFLIIILFGCSNEQEGYDESNSQLRDYLNLGFVLSDSINSSNTIKVFSIEEARGLIQEFDRQCKFIGSEEKVRYVKLSPTTRGLSDLCSAHIVCEHNGYDEILDFMYWTYRGGEEVTYEFLEPAVYDLLPKYPLVGTYGARIRSAEQGHKCLFISTYLQSAFEIQPPGGLPPIRYYNTQINYWTFALGSRGVWYARGDKEYPVIKEDEIDIGEDGIYVPELGE